MNVIDIIIAEPYDIYRAGLRTLLQDYANFRIAGIATTAPELVKAYSKKPNAVCILSSGLTDTNIHDVMRQIKSVQKNAKVIVFTHSTDLSHLHQSLKAGIKGYITKNITMDELSDVILSVASGEQSFSKAVSKMMVGKYADLTKKISLANRKGLTKREKEVLKYIVEGHTSAEIATKLYISPRTVETHRSNLMNKLEMKNTAALVRYAIEEKDLI